MWGLAHYIAVYCKYTDNGVSKLLIFNLCECLASFPGLSWAMGSGRGERQGGYDKLS